MNKQNKCLHSNMIQQIIIVMRRQVITANMFQTKVNTIVLRLQRHLYKQDDGIFKHLAALIGVLKKGRVANLDTLGTNKYTKCTNILPILHIRLKKCHNKKGKVLTQSGRLIFYFVYRCLEKHPIKQVSQRSPNLILRQYRYNHLRDTNKLISLIFDFFYRDTYKRRRW